MNSNYALVERETHVEVSRTIYAARISLPPPAPDDSEKQRTSIS